MFGDGLALAFRFICIDQLGRDLFPLAALGAEVAYAIALDLVFAHGVVGAVLKI